MKIKQFSLGFLFALTVLSCASFEYVRFGLNLEDQKLLHFKDPSQDRPLSDCSRGSDNKFKCVVLFADDFYKLKSDYERMVEQLKNCQR